MKITFLLPNCRAGLLGWLAAACFSFAALPVSQGRPLTPDEAHAAWMRSKLQVREPGVWRSEQVTQGKKTTTTVTTYELRLPSGQCRVRTERSTVSKERPGEGKKSIALHDSEGQWSVHDTVAILQPVLFDEKNVQRTFVKRVMSEMGRSDPSQRAALVGSYGGNWSGERIMVGGSARLRLVYEFGPETHKFMRELMLELAENAKKEVPLVFRMFVTSSRIERAVDEQLPVREVRVIDEETGIILAQCTVRQKDKGDPKEPQPVPAWVRCEGISADVFDVPPKLQKLRPKTMGKFLRLEIEYAGKDLKARQAAAKASKASAYKEQKNNGLPAS